MLKTARTDSGTTARSTAGTTIVTTGYATAISGIATRAHAVDDRLLKWVFIPVSQVNVRIREQKSSPSGGQRTGARFAAQGASAAASKFYLGGAASSGMLVDKFHQVAGDPSGVVASHSRLFKVVAEDGDNA